MSSEDAEALISPLWSTESAPQGQSSSGRDHKKEPWQIHTSFWHKTHGRSVGFHFARLCRWAVDRSLCKPEHGGEGPSRLALHGCPLSPDVGADLLAIKASETSPSTAICSPLEVRPGGSLPRGGAPLAGGADTQNWGTGRRGSAHTRGRSRQWRERRSWPRVLQVRRGSVLQSLPPPYSLLPAGHEAPAGAPSASCLTASLPAEHLSGAV